MSNLTNVLTGAVRPVQDYFMLGNVKSPGRCTIVHPGSPRNWDVRQGYGFSGAFVVYTGDGLAKFDVLIDIWDDSQWADWDRFAKLCLAKPPVGTKPKALDIDHPLLALEPWKITSVVVEDVGGFEQDENGLWTCAISFLQYRAPKPALGKPLASIPNVVKAPPTAEDAGDVKIQQLLGQLNTLAKGP